MKSARHQLQVKLRVRNFSTNLCANSLAGGYLVLVLDRSLVGSNGLSGSWPGDAARTGVPARIGKSCGKINV